LANLPARSTIATQRGLEKPLHIVIIVTYAHPYIGSGLGVVAKFQAEYLAAQGHHVILISSNIPQTSKTFVLNNVTYIKVPAWALLEKVHVPVPVLFFNKSVFNALERADIVHVHDILYPSSLFAALIAKLCRKKVVLTQHVPHVEYDNKLVNVIEKLAFCTVGLGTLWASESVVVLNTTVYKWMNKYKKKVYHIPNGVDFKLFNKPTKEEKKVIREQYNIPMDEFVVLFVGRFVPKKGFDILYNAKDPSYLLVFVGGGMIPEHMKADQSIKVLGPLPQEELAMLYKASDVFILPSYGEGFPLSIQEAMATGLPIITSKQNNLDRTLDSTLIEYIDVTEANIKSAIRKIQNDRVLRQEMSEHSHKTAKENYSWEKNTTKLLDIYYGKAN
jgi:D-inositol-3-phosphate glycosyltransferase